MLHTPENLQENVRSSLQIATKSATLWDARKPCFYGYLNWASLNQNNFLTFSVAYSWPPPLKNTYNWFPGFNIQVTSFKPLLKCHHLRVAFAKRHCLKCHPTPSTPFSLASLFFWPAMATWHFTIYFLIICWLVLSPSGMYVPWEQICFVGYCTSSA